MVKVRDLVVVNKLVVGQLCLEGVSDSSRCHFLMVLLLKRFNKNVSSLGGEVPLELGL
jgi:hypothetical protein